MNSRNLNDKAFEYKLKSSKDFKKINHKELISLPAYNGILDMYINKIKFKMLNINNDDGVTIKFFWRDEYEYLSTILWSNLCKKNAVFIDVGSHTGIYSIIGKLSFEKNFIISIEPYFLNYARMISNLRLNNISSNDCILAAAMDKTGSINFDILNNNYYHTMGGKPNKSGALKVKSIALDNINFAKSKMSIGAIKIDAEGFEDKVLRGAIKIIKESQPDIILEYNETNFENCMQILESFKYNVYFINDNLRNIEKFSNLTDDRIKINNINNSFPDEGKNYLFTKKNISEVMNLIS
ncbi:MAG: hypothetical protein CFH21_00903 [Alphaproteobacteria bacterium MarineAlpha5_Bin11]|nr:hypothetical protein [Pelagibacteraceae bacterium]PPR43115.1 MAG: hypothetical protein CFH21_00903 [Alphaproteobacteria bacterium MarineAlpha5_Bin11]PPR51899.1 MAG: hypothetical protein CFH20_00318 [Alphaproteobacteria bacterium MarineAlpha5_Bin10]|tara:strand:- start:985 stop:1872 length:888 start_codon:yes stop_codon:yes gene_type:complete